MVEAVLLCNEELHAAIGLEHCGQKNSPDGNVDLGEMHGCLALNHVPSMKAVCGFHALQFRRRNILQDGRFKNGSQLVGFNRHRGKLMASRRGGLMNAGGCSGASGGGNSSGSGGRGMMISRQGRAASEERCCFQMPLHYPRYSKSDYEAMPEWQLDRLLEQYGLLAAGSVEQKRMFAIGAFLWGR
ncbi:hypothetical protein AKJ16_DCAP25420 [Drosera capensis]